MGSLVLNGATSGSTTLTPTDAVTATLTLPSTSGTVLTTTSPKTGNVIQVVSATYSTETSFTSTSFVTTNLTASITPSSSSNKILITAVLPIQAGSSGIVTYTIYRGATNLNSTGFGRWYTASADTNAVMMYLDSPSTTSATSYSVYIKTSASTAYYCVNNESASIVLQEIAA